MIDNHTSICMILRNRKEYNLFASAAASVGLGQQPVFFDNAEKAFDAALKKRFQLFIVRQEIVGWKGIVFIQKLRQDSRYGSETQFFVADMIDSSIIHTLYELDIRHVLVTPITPLRIEKKFQALLQEENALNPVEQAYRQAKSALAQQFFDRAGQLIEELLRNQPSNPKILILAGDYQVQLNQLEEAMGLYHRAIAANPQSAVATYKLAYVFNRMKQFHKSAEILHRLAEMSPHNLNLLENAGNANLEVGEMQKARQHIERVQELDSTNTDAAHTLAQISFAENDFEGMMKVMEANSSPKEYIAFLNNKGVELIRQGQVDKALEMYHQCLKTIQNNPYAYAIYYNMGLAYRRTGELSSARDYLKKALRANPSFAKAKATLDAIDAQVKKGA